MHLTAHPHLIVIIALAIPFLSCSKKPTDPIPPSVYESLPELPVADHAHPIRGEQTHFIEVQLTSHGWRVQGGPATLDTAAIQDQIIRLKLKIKAEGYAPYVFIEADKECSIKQIRDILMASARSGIDKSLLAVKPSISHTNIINRAIHIITPVVTACGAYSIPQFKISIKRNDSIQINNHEDKDILDSDSTLLHLPQLLSRLSGYTSGCQASGNRPAISLCVSPESTYQQMINVFNLFYKLNIRHFSLSFSESYEENHGYYTILPLPAPAQ